MEELKKELRSVLICEKFGIELSRLNSEYRDLTGSNINFDRTKFRNLDDFLLSLTDTVYLNRSNGTVFVHAIASDKQKSLKNLISRQKTGKKKPPIRQQLHSSNYRSYSSTSYTRYRSDKRDYNSYFRNGSSQKNVYSNSDSFNVRSQQPNKPDEDRVVQRRPDRKINEPLINGSKENEISKLKSSKLSVYEKADLIDRVLELFENSYDLFFSELVEEMFEEKFSFKLPENWIDLISASRKFDIQRSQVGNRSIVIVGLPIKQNISTNENSNDFTEFKEAKQLNNLKVDQELPNKVDELNFDKLSIYEKVDFIDKVLELFENSYDLFFSDLVEKMFEEKFSFKLPENWIDLISGSNKFDIQRSQVGNRSIVIVGLPIKKIKSTNENLNDFTEFKEAKKLNNLKVDQELLKDRDNDFNNLEDNEDIQELPMELEFPKDEWFPVIVLGTGDSNEVILRLMNNAEKLDELIDLMESYYNKKKLGERVKSNLKINKIYVAAFNEVKSAVFRVKVTKIENDEIHCWFLDDGVNEKINKSNLFKIEKEFLNLPFQAFAAKLDGLDPIHKVMIHSFIEKKLNDNDDSYCVIATIANLDNPKKFILYDTTGDEDINLNDEIKKFIKNSISSF